MIVVGSGISGLFVALEARKLGPVLVLTKGSIEDTNTAWAQGGIAAAVGPLDSVEAHLADTIEAGDGLVDEEAARVLCSEAPARIRDLVEYGVSFDSLDGEALLGREAAHGHNRILHAGGDRTGAAIETALSRGAQQPSITILDHTLVTSLLTERDRVTGVQVRDLHSQRDEYYEAEAVVLATGGAGRLFAHTTNPEVATGDGVVLAFEVGAEIADLEFFQFHPTAFRADGRPPFLISEAVRGEGAVLRNLTGDAFMLRHDQRGDLAPRDVVARAIVHEMTLTGADHVWLDCTGMGNVDAAARFPGIYAFCKDQGLDMRRDPIPVAPAAHYFMGGVRTDTWGRTTVPGLYACGEVACTGVHGANRLASNSLMETVVFGKRIVEHLSSGEPGAAVPHSGAQPFTPERGLAPSKAVIQATMWEHAGIERSEESLKAGLRKAGSWMDHSTAQTRDTQERLQMGILARLMLHGALQREESRGAHYRLDFPRRDDERWRRQQVFVHGS
jgi:L-aspartate oxidase